jgi:GT2 family glycosyltransferase
MPVGTGHIIMRKQAILKVGGFKACMAGEDIDITRKITNNGFYLYNKENEEVYHLHCKTYREFMNKYRRDVCATLQAESNGEQPKNNRFTFAVENLVLPIFTCMSGIKKDRDLAWLWHPIICYSKAFCALKMCILKK